MGSEMCIRDRTYDERMHKEKGMGLAKEIFNKDNLHLLKGNIGISHNRYPTHGGFSHGEVQPFWTSVPYGIALAHNGNLTNYEELAKEVTKEETRYLIQQATLRSFFICLQIDCTKTVHLRIVKSSLSFFAMQ